MLIADTPCPAITLLIFQCLLLALFTFFAFFNYLYGIASLWKPKIRRTQPSGQKVAVVIVAFNEEQVLEDTIHACDRLTYPNKLTLLADDSANPKVVDSLRELAKSRGCKKLFWRPSQQYKSEDSCSPNEEPVEIWESPDFVLFHRSNNAGFKGGSLKKVHEYLKVRKIEMMYLLDADWHPEHDAIERTISVLEANKDVAFVQTKRLSFPKGLNLFQKYISILEEGCYHVDFQGRQVLGHPILFSGCCTLLRLEAIAQVGGFKAGHLTEDLDVTDRLWLAGWKGIYDGDVDNYGEVPFAYDHYRRQQERWAAGSARSMREFFWSIVMTKHLSIVGKLSAIRQNGYFTTAILTSAAIILSMATILWLTIAWNSYAVEYYLYILSTVKIPFLTLLYLCIGSNLVEPLITILVKKRKFSYLAHLPMAVWYAWSVLVTYVLGNVKGLFRLKLDWFRTPKFSRRNVGHLSRVPTSLRAVNIAILVAFMVLYFNEGWIFGWFDEFALLLIPAFMLASIE